MNINSSIEQVFAAANNKTDITVNWENVLQFFQTIVGANRNALTTYMLSVFRLDSSNIELRSHLFSHRHIHIYSVLSMAEGYFGVDFKDERYALIPYAIDLFIKSLSEKKSPYIGFIHEERVGKQRYMSIMTRNYELEGKIKIDRWEYGYSTSLHYIMALYLLLANPTLDPRLIELRVQLLVGK